MIGALSTSGAVDGLQRDLLQFHRILLPSATPDLVRKSTRCATLLVCQDTFCLNSFFPVGKEEGNEGSFRNNLSNKRLARIMCESFANKG